MSETNEFQLHPQLRADSLTVGQLPLCDLRLVNDSRFPWCLLIPRIPDITELHHLPTAHRQSMMSEVETLSTYLLENTEATKINVAALGNMVPQLHIHVIGRHSLDPAWPNPVWSAGSAEHYKKTNAQALIVALREALISN